MSYWQAVAKRKYNRDILFLLSIIFSYTLRFNFNSLVLKGHLIKKVAFKYIIIYKDIQLKNKNVGIYK